METHTVPGRVLATLAGLACAAGGLTILLDRQLLHPFGWETLQWLIILMVFGVIAFGHLMVTAAKSGHWPSALGFLAMFVFGTWLVVYSSVGRQVEAAGTTSLSVEDVNKKIADKSADLDSARQRKAYADAQIQKTMTGSVCGRGCRDWTQNAKDIAVVIRQLETDIGALGPQKPVNAQAEAMADIVLLFPIPATKAQIVVVLTLLVPFAKTLFFEIGSIVGLGFAFRPRPLPRMFSGQKSETSTNVELPSMSAVSAQLPESPNDGPKGGRKTKKRLPKNVVSFSGKHQVVVALEKNGGSVSSNHRLAELMGVSDGEASKRWKEIKDRLDVQRIGKNLSIALKTDRMSVVSSL